jgi:hypothetical protein
LVLSHQTYIPDSTGSCDLGLRTGDKCLPKKRGGSVSLMRQKSGRTRTGPGMTSGWALV